MKEEDNNIEGNLKIEENKELINNKDCNIEQNNNNINEPLIKDDIPFNPSENNIENKNNQQNNIILVNNENNQNNINQNNNNNQQNTGVNQNNNNYSNNQPFNNNNLGNFNSQMNYQIDPNLDEIYNPLEVEETGCFSCCSYAVRSAFLGCGCAWFIAIIFFYAFIWKDNRYYY